MTIQNKIKPFPKHLIQDWEKSDGVNFAIALAQITKWIIHVDWFSTNVDGPEEHMIPLRVYVGSNDDRIYDFTGIYSINEFNGKIIQDIARRRVHGYGNVLTRYYDEKKIRNLPLRIKPNDKDIAKAKEALFNNTSFLQRIPKRQNLHVPAEIAADFTWGKCAVYAQALEDNVDVTAIAIVAEKFKFGSEFERNNLGYVHSLAKHPNGEYEDIWGIQPLQKILDRFGVEEYKLCIDTHKDVTTNLKTNSQELYKKFYDQSVELIELGSKT
ncbi:hypothetical protein MUB18_20620 [Sphingobacterium sp. PCS056]|uniref:hypothetical protein n=1 Tax=Sphingobacterium sp. PCS056 TaxID=2931400 RepID=UPI00200EB733|nr:hypothetical protein [Sphingobacterium sp. PCS056]UPZ36493.1 hypothetical protein MUB18_20620 [Sphingobacterium sp. PCS056]